LSLRTTLSTVVNCQLSDDSWSQAVLPVRWGGLGFRDLAASAFHSSLAATASAVNFLLTLSHAAPIQILRASACNNWASISGHSLEDQPQLDPQRTWDEAVCRKQFTTQMAAASGAARARLLEYQSCPSGCWLVALTNPCFPAGRPQIEDICGAVSGFLHS